MEYWQDFQRLEFANEILMAAGALLVLVGVMKIIRSSIQLIFWVFLAGAGVASVAYGWNHSTLDLPGKSPIDIADYIGPGKQMSADVLQLLCTKWYESEEAELL